MVIISNQCNQILIFIIWASIHICIITPFVENIVKQPTEQKFQKINLSNEAFKRRVADIVGGVFILNECGFKENDGFLVAEKVNTDLYIKVIGLLDNEIKKL